MTARAEPARADRAWTARVARADGQAPVGVLHLVDTLAVGGAERMAVNLVNRLPRGQFAAHLCTTRLEGPLASAVAPDVARLALGRRATLDAGAVARLRAYVRAHDIRVLHAHGSTVFVAALAAVGLADVRVIWHVHYGRYAAEQAAGWAYRALRGRVHHTVAVSEPLADWAVRRLGFPADRVSYVPNFVDPFGAGCASDLPGRTGGRVVCVANLLPEKDHHTLLRAMTRVVRTHPDAHLLLVGSLANAPYVAKVRDEIARWGLSAHVSLLGQRADVPAVLRGSDVAVLSSRAEGLPLALIEYGMVDLPVVVTDVGQCAAVVSSPAHGVVVPPSDPAALADGLAGLLASPELRASLGAALGRRVRLLFNGERVMEQICGVYARAVAH